MTANPDPLDDLRTALTATSTVVVEIAPEQHGAPTPCAEWDVAALAGHLVGSLERYGDAFGAPTLPEDPDAGLRERFTAAAARLDLVLAQTDVATTQVVVPLGTVPGPVALQLATVEILVHGWDLARATGHEVAWDDDVAERARTFSERAVGMVPPDRSPFGSPQAVADDAPAMDRLVALLGRSPDRS